MKQTGIISEWKFYVCNVCLLSFRYLFICFCSISRTRVSPVSLSTGIGVKMVFVSMMFHSNQYDIPIRPVFGPIPTEMLCHYPRTCIPASTYPIHLFN